jgi:hypothetical protein
VKDIIASFPYPIIPTVQGEPDYHTIHSMRKLLRAKARSIESHLGGGATGHLGIIVSNATYATVAPVGDSGIAGRGTQQYRWGYRGPTTIGTSSLGGGYGYHQNLDNRGASIEKTNYHGI